MEETFESETLNIDNKINNIDIDIHDNDITPFVVSPFFENTCPAIQENNEVTQETILLETTLPPKEAYPEYQIEESMTAFHTTSPTIPPPKDSTSLTDHLSESFYNVLLKPAASSLILLAMEYGSVAHMFEDKIAPFMATHYLTNPFMDDISDNIIFPLFNNTLSDDQSQPKLIEDVLRLGLLVGGEVLARENGVSLTGDLDKRVLKTGSRSIYRASKEWIEESVNEWLGDGMYDSLIPCADMLAFAARSLTDNPYLNIVFDRFNDEFIFNRGMDSLYKEDGSDWEYAALGFAYKLATSHHDIQNNYMRNPARMHNPAFLIFTATTFIPIFRSVIKDVIDPVITQTESVFWDPETPVWQQATLAVLTGTFLAMVPGGWIVPAGMLAHELMN